MKINLGNNVNLSELEEDLEYVSTKDQKEAQKKKEHKITRRMVKK